MTDIILDHNNDLADMEMAAFVANTLEDFYPGWGWRVSIQEHSIANVFNSRMEGAIKAQAGNKPYGFRIFLDCPSVSELKRKVVMAGGELLERGGQTATGWSESKRITKVDMS